MVKVHLRQISAEGLHLEGETDSECLGLKEIGIKALSPLKYSLDVGLSHGGLFATGRLSVVVELKCVSTLEDFPYEIQVEDFAIQIELTGSEVVDLTPMVREDILLSLPPYPRKDREGANKTHHGPAETSIPEKGGKFGSPAWDVLNELKNKK